MFGISDLPQGSLEHSDMKMATSEGLWLAAEVKQRVVIGCWG